MARTMTARAANGDGSALRHPVTTADNRPNSRPQRAVQRRRRTGLRRDSRNAPRRTTPANRTSAERPWTLLQLHVRWPTSTAGLRTLRPRQSQGACARTRSATGESPAPPSRVPSPPYRRVGPQPEEADVPFDSCRGQSAETVHTLSAAPSATRVAGQEGARRALLRAFLRVACRRYVRTIGPARGVRAWGIGTSPPGDSEQTPPDPI